MLRTQLGECAKEARVVCFGTQLGECAKEARVVC